MTREVVAIFGFRHTPELSPLAWVSRLEEFVQHHALSQLALDLGYCAVNIVSQSRMP
jgi:hypothetical protein